LDQSLHILTVGSSPSFGGLERFQIEIARAMAERGHRITAVAGPDTPFAYACADAGFSVRAVRFHGYVAPIGTLRLAGIMRTEAPDVVHYRLSRDIWSVAPAARLAGLTGRVVHTLGMNPGGRLDNPLHRWLRHTLGAFVCPTPRTAAAAERVWGMSAGEALLIPNFVDERRFEPEETLAARAAEQRAARNVDEGTILVGMLGRLEPDKGVETLVAAAEELQSTSDSVRFVVAGPTSPGRSDWLAGLKERAAQYLGDRLRFEGPVPADEVPAFMRSLDLFVLPSLRETFGTVLVEAMLAGTAVVSARGPGPDFILADGACGMAFEPQDALALAGHLRDLSNDPDRRAHLGAAGRERALTAFSRSMVAPQYEALFQELAGKR